VHSPPRGPPRERLPPSAHHADAVVPTAYLAAQGADVQPLTVGAEVGRARAADGRVVGNRRAVEHAGPALGNDPDRRVADRTRDAEAAPAAILTALLRAALTARRAGRVRHALEIAGAGRRRPLVLHACRVLLLPVTVVAPILLARLAGGGSVREHGSLVEAVIARSDRPPGAASQERERDGHHDVPHDGSLH